jgi:hypothetical protein
MVYGICPADPAGTDFDNRFGAMGLHSSDPGKPEKRDEDDGDDSPVTPLDEPRPPRVQDPPPQPDTKGPYVVGSHVDERRAER